MTYIFDIDGTLADISHRLHFIQNKTAKFQDWQAFFKACPDDKPIPEVLSVCHALQSANHVIALISGRSDEIQAETSKWLNEQHINFDFLLMRRAGDHREDSVVKAELLDELLRRWPKPIGGVFEDRKQVVDMYRARGLRVFQVEAGEF